MSEGTAIQLGDIFEVDGRKVKLKEGFDPSIAVRLFVHQVNSELSTTPPAEIPLKELLLQASSVTLGKIEDALSEFRTLIAAVNQQIDQTQSPSRTDE
ncbi:hypothetical protein AU106_gp017 [Sinorhizobium phage phiM9]|uniref:Uncharacterized protein n=1 Tax=Sinorhizobium phage phiM9 TaxID=1636182 RepID=A0A0F6R7B6_9CAUD|nr:hypothetical protein AU106_gp017 [Sinorhizobium phage phiM9]AKE44648.1 hypothetical protein Sm_phiM9_018 [Sinorhizobium phage phiM9]